MTFIKLEKRPKNKKDRFPDVFDFFPENKVPVEKGENDDEYFVLFSSQEHELDYYRVVFKFIKENYGAFSLNLFAQVFNPTNDLFIKISGLKKHGLVTKIIEKS